MGSKMGATPAVARSSRSADTRNQLMAAAERLFAERGVDNVSHRRISMAAGQGNNAAVNYHFGTTAALVGAIVEHHTAQVEDLRRSLLDEVGDSRDLRVWLECVVRPIALHLEQISGPTWYARLCAQLLADPQWRQLVTDRAFDSEPLRRAVEGLQACVPDLPVEVQAEREEMTRLLVVDVFAARESALAAGAPVPRPSWLACADGLVGALAGLWSAPAETSS